MKDSNSVTKHSEETIKKMQSLKDAGFSSRQIAAIVLGSDTKKSTVNSILNKVDKKVEKEDNSPKKILFVPDCQVRKGVDMTYLTAIGQYIVDKKPDIIVNIGDFYDFPSLSSYDKGKTSFEGRRLKDDIEYGKLGMQKLINPLREYQKSNPSYRPRMVFCLGNHEERLKRVSNNNSEFEGFIGYHLLDLEKDWEVHDFLKPVNIQGINFVHYLSNPMSGKPYGGSAATQLKSVGTSFCVGHKQTLDVAIQPVLDGTMRIGIVAGACYPFDESYKGFQGNTYFRGVVMLHEAANGFADPSFISTDFLIRRLK
ncbi:MAG: metallophosphoesterase [Chitinophagales bacterium]|nr:metallophosphoesterase [Chitinophagales bacterium]